MRSLAWFVRSKIVKGLSITLIILISIIGINPSFFADSSEPQTHYIYVDSQEPQKSAIPDTIKQFDKIFITLRTYSNQKADINFDNQAFRIISERVINLPDMKVPDYNPELFGRSYEYEMIALKQGRNDISFSISQNESKIKISFNVSEIRTNSQSVFAGEVTEKPKVGVLKPLVILVDFQDQSANYDLSTPEFYQELLFGEGNKSLYDYYLENSFGKLEIKGEVYPQWVTAPNNYSYYENHYNGMGYYPNNSQKLVEDIINVIIPNVDFSRYDGNNDGVVDGIIIIYAGKKPDSKNPYRIYPHEWSIKSQERNGKTILSYAILPEFIHQPGDTTIGPFCHEFGHILGAIDLYDLDGLSYFKYDGEKSYGLGKWSIMAYGTWGTKVKYGDSPSDFDAWHKVKFGWINPITITESMDSASIPAIETEGGEIYKFVSPTNPKEYFLVENRQKIGFDSSLPGPGLLIYHVDESMNSNNYTWYPDKTNNDKHYFIAVIQADNLWHLEKYKNYGDAGDPFPGITNNRDFGNNTSPNNLFYNGKGEDFKIKNISDTGIVMTCDFIINNLTATSGNNKSTQENDTKIPDYTQEVNSNIQEIDTNTQEDNKNIIEISNLSE